jgi:hypothetical protein
MQKPLSLEELSWRYGGAIPSDDLRWRVENAALLTPEQRLQALEEIRHNAAVQKYGCMPRLERCIRIRRLTDPDPESDGWNAEHVEDR